jgi:hypothetical protein
MAGDADLKVGPTMRMHGGSCDKQNHVFDVEVTVSDLESARLYTVGLESE